MAIPIDIPDQMIAVGLNFRSHCEETGEPIPKTPMLFAHWPNALAGPGDIIVPEVLKDDFIDFEVELGVIIGKEAKDVGVDDALDFVKGYCCFNDVSARRLQLGAEGGQHTMGKCVDGFDPVGPMTPASEIPDPQNLVMRTVLNGEVVQEENTSDHVFGVAEVIAYITRTVTLRPNDLINMGSPSGVGWLRDPQLEMVHGDDCVIECDGLEPLKNRIVQAWR
jgi:2-keto-4-pentenoate hydratase/2-oxohepta-3-ene-1,7-dioic acid hydratase in catechol pathway